MSSIMKEFKMSPIKIDGHEDEFDKTNKQLKNENSSPISSDGLINLANEFYRQPSRYVDIIKTIRHRMESGRA
jgi:hypothetical protein